MVFRKPYAFFIKNFRKFHILLIILCGYIYSKSLQVGTFNKEFLNYLSYDSYTEPISKLLSPLLYVFLFLTIAIFLILVIILKRKEKPWKLYLIPILEYIALFFIFSFITNFYNTYDGSLSTTTIRALNSFLSIAIFFQYPVFLILIIRILGLDLKKFNFSADQEFLELNQEDREEFEVNVNFDKNSIKRLIKKTKRTLGYIYEEHKYICNLIFTIIVIVILYKSYVYFGVEHKVIKENNTFNVNGYTMSINKSYYTTKDKTGNIIEDNSAFVILNISVINNGISRKFDGNDFHIISGANNYTFQGNTYSKLFSDIGNSFPLEKIKNGEKKNFALIFKVDKNINYKNFVLYYQEYKGNTSYLRKIKLDLVDVSKLEEEKKLKVTETLKYTDSLDVSKEFTYENISYSNSINYNIESCNKDNNCSIISKNYNVVNGYKALIIKFTSPDYEGGELIDFTKEYAKVNYIDTDGFYRSLSIVNLLENKDYLGKYLYIKVPDNIENMKEVNIVYTIRNKRYSYKIK